MPLALVIGDTGNHSGEPIISGSSRTIIAGKGAAHLTSSIEGHPLGNDYHSGPTIAGTNTENRTIVNNNPMAADGASGSCGDTLSASTTSRTTVS